MASGLKHVDTDKLSASPLIKICGITDAQQARDVAALGADAIGLNFVETAARFLTIGDAVDVTGAMGNNALRVRVFMDATSPAVEAVLRDVALDWLQFHGNEDGSFGREILNYTN